MVELGRIDIITEVYMLASQLALTQEGHIETIFHIFGYLKGHHNAWMVFNQTYPTTDMSMFRDHDWCDFYGDVKEDITPNTPETRGKEVDLRIFVDSFHGGDKLTRQPITGYIIFLKNAPIACYSKKQATIETSVFGAEFVVMKIGMETLRGLQYKLRMMVFPISVPSLIYGGNMSVIHNTQQPESTMKKNSNSICCHSLRESVEMKESMTGNVPSVGNPADICKKVVPGGAKRNHLIGKVLHDLNEQ